MKLVFGPGNTGTPIPRLWNPLVFLGMAVVFIFTAIFASVGAALCLIWAPFSLVHTIRMKEK